MATHLVTGYAGSEHIKSEDQGSFNASFFGTGQFVMEAGNQLEASIIDNNTVRILDGDILMKGRHIRVNPDTYEDMIIENGTAGVNRCDLIVMEYSKVPETGIETATLKVLKGTAASGTASVPSYTDGDILTGAILNQMPLYKVLIEGVVLVDVVSLFDTIPTFQTLAEMYRAKFIKDCETHLNSLGILDTMEEVNANTQDNQLAGAKAVKELGETLDYVELTKGFDLNNATSSRWYRSSKSETVASLVNTPTTFLSGEVVIEWRASESSNNYGSQIVYYTNGTTNGIYTRNRNNTTWSDWESLSTNKDLDNYLPLTGGYMQGSIHPSEIDKYYLGLPNLPWLALYATNLMLAKNAVSYGHAQVAEGTTTIRGLGVLNLGNRIKEGNAGNAYGAVRLYGTGHGYTEIRPSYNGDTDFGLTLPSSAGRLLCNSDFVVTGSANEATLTINLD